MKPYKTVKSNSLAEFIVNKSRFIGSCFPVSTEEAALFRLNETRARYSDATHNCYAYSIRESGIKRFSDDGEPGGTAGLPIIQVINNKNLVDCIVIVTRYFGGILLGAGGLIRAYSRSASDALNASGVRPMLVGRTVEIVMDYSRYGTVEGIVRGIANVDSVEFLENVKIKCTVLDENSDRLIKAIIERTDGRITPQLLEYCYIEGDI
ncbi:MAG: YigZ family protein [Clostridia bacterium]